MLKILLHRPWIAVLLVALGVVPAAFASPLRQGDEITLVYGQTVDGQINDAQPSVWYAFGAQTSDVITITMIVTGGGLDPFVVLNDTSRIPLATDDNSGGGVNARLTFVIPVAGRYTIQATHAGGIPPEGGGTFSLNLTAAVDGAAPAAPSTLIPATPETSVPDLQGDLPAAQGDGVRLLRLQAGSPVRDLLDRQIAVRFYWFEANQGDQIAVTPEQLADFMPLIVLYDGGFTELARGQPGAGLRSILPSEGIYFLIVSLPEAGSAGGNFGFIFDLTGNPAVSGDFIDIAYGDTQRSTIDAATSAVTYRFRGSASDPVRITMSRAGGDLNSYLYLLDGSGQLLTEDNDSGGDNGNAQIAYTLPADGEYLIVATRQGQTRGTTNGSYVLDLVSDAAAPIVEPTVVPTLPTEYAAFPQIAYGDTVEGELTAAKFMEIYVFQGTGGDPVAIEMNGQNPDDPNGLDPLLILLDDGRIPLIEDDDIVDGVDRDARIEFTLPRAGYYAIVATRFDQDAGTSVGPYMLTLSGPGGPATTGEAAAPTLTTPISKLTPMQLIPGEPVQANFATNAVLYTFDASDGSLVDLAVTTDPGLDSVLILADENLNEILSSATGALTGITLPKTGTYLVLLSPRFGPANTAPGGYILALTQTAQGETPPVAEGPQELSYGAATDGTIDDETISQVYTFSGTAGDEVRITMEAAPDSSLDCYLELQDAAGTVLEANDDIDPGVVRDARVTAELPADGTYTILASRYVGPDADPTSGAYRLTLEVVGGSSAPAATTVADIVPITYGQTQVDEINNEQHIVFYVFDAAAGDVVTIEVTHLTGNLDSVLHLYQSSGSQWIEIASDDDGPTGDTYEPLLSNIVLPQPGKYLIAVSRYGLEREDSTGTFSLTLTRAS